MTRRILFLDALLLTVLILGAVKVSQDWAAFDGIRQVSAVQPEQEAFPVVALSNAPASNTIADWTEIATLNPFSFDRNDVAIMKPVAAPVPAGPKPILFGIMDLGSGPLAMLAPGQPGNRDYRGVNIGEVIEGWKVIEIQPKAVVVESNGTRETVIMNDPTAQVARVYAQRSAARTPPPQVIVPTNPSAAAAAPSGSGAAPATPGTRRVTIQTPFGVVVREEPIQ